jgi:phosphoglycerate dehydrogenase-like enzyme
MAFPLCGLNFAQNRFIRLSVTSQRRPRPAKSAAKKGGNMRVAILDDYQRVALSVADWSRVPAGTEIVPFADHVEDDDLLVARLSEFDAVCRMRERTPFPRRILERLPRLKLILATGFRNVRSIDLAVADELGITVCSTGVHHYPTSELAWGLILSLFRKIHTEAASVRAGGWQTALGSGLNGKTLGVMGLGNLGVPVARIGLAFGMKVVAWSPNLTQVRASPIGAECVSKAELFSNSDAITIHMPESERTIGIVGADDIARMKPTAFLINTSRAPLVDQDALMAALMERRIGGAGIDVFDEEPLPLGHPYRHLPNVLVTPHIGYVIRENYEIFYGESVENLLAYMAGRPIRVLDRNGNIRAEKQS